MNDNVENINTEDAPMDANVKNNTNEDNTPKIDKLSCPSHVTKATIPIP